MSSQEPRLDRDALEALLQDLAETQHGLVTRNQLLRAGATPSWIRGRVRRRRFIPLQRGVYQVGPVRTSYAREMAALLASGPHSTLCRRTAAALQQLLPAQPEREQVEVYVGEVLRRRPGVRAYRTGTLRPDEVTELQGLRVTTPERTLLDLAARSTLRELRQALARAERLGLFDRPRLLELAGRHSKRRGVGQLRVLVEERGEADFTRSEAEARFLELVRRSKLPRPELNVHLEGFEVDFLWRKPGLVVEVDGFEFHSSRRAFESDRRRDARLAAAGFRVVRVTWRQLEGRPEEVLARVAQALVRREREAS